MGIGIRTKTVAMELALPQREDGMVVEHIEDEPTWPYERTDVFVGRTRTEYLKQSQRS